MHMRCITAMPRSLAQFDSIGSNTIKTVFAEGLSAYRAGRFAEAEGVCNRVLETEPDHADCRHLLGVIFYQRGNYAAAVNHIALSLKIRPQNLQALKNLGNALKALKHLDQALAIYNHALAMKPDDAEAHLHIGKLLMGLGRLEEALDSYERAVCLRKDCAEAHCDKGNALFELRRFELAIASFGDALALQPDYVEAHNNRGNALVKLERLEEAVASYDSALALRPEYAEVHSNKGNALLGLNRFAEALSCYDRAIALQPELAETYSNRGDALYNMGRFQEALASCDRAIVLRPRCAEAHSNRGNALVGLADFEEALASYGRAVAIQPDYTHAHFNESICRLLIADFSNGWKKYEWRRQTNIIRDERRFFAQPQWTGSDEVDGRTILIHAEQGLGDTLQFCRYAPLVAQRAGRVILEVQKPLKALMMSLPGIAQIISFGETLPAFDFQCPLLSLPLAFGTRIDSIPADAPYLFAPEEKRNFWRDRIGRHKNLKVGLVWAGAARNRADQQRSINFDCLAAVVQSEGCEFYSLQKGQDAVEQLRNSPLRDRVIDWTDDFQDFSDTAALIEHLDLVITVDTSVAHLAGALGKPFWLLNRYNTCWRWLLDRDDNPWYPTARLFRQDSARQWAPVITRVCAALHDHVRRFGLD